MRRRGPTVDLRAGGAIWNGVEIPRIKPAEHTAARIDGRLPQNRALDPSDSLWSAGPLRPHAYAQVRREPVVRARGECVSRPATGGEHGGDGDREAAAAHEGPLYAPLAVADVVPAQASCPECGAPAKAHAKACGDCGGEVRAVVVLTNPQGREVLVDP
jgi:hypothetical protein